MPGYEIIECAAMKPNNTDGIAPYEHRIGFIDFLREIRNEANDIPRLSSYCRG